ncbi:39S ribosomal protein L49 mitochondrial [Biomphalaria pfeifferi]|uniref:Large ribosomal subunit protein mL49 n=1 Tax=Biomphalaria pfeifferi TaxID=112525 RepID=A0AAD8BJ88_BIOPF|nr:39S ribosomal protein L49 mitochondrial [Biomphalaria pfeifferi]
MAAYTVALFRACSQCKRILKPVSAAIDKSHVSKLRSVLEGSKRLLTTAPPQSTDPIEDKSEYPVDFEISYDEFKHVLPLLPIETVPGVPNHPSYPTPSGWFPPNLELRSKQKYLVRRTKNHMLPVYPGTTHKRIEHIKTVQHYVHIKKIEGDIWALEADLRFHLEQKTGLPKIKTQVHEVGRFIRVRGMYADEVASFLFGRGM